MLKLLCMSKHIKQIYVALQMAENDIKVLVGEYFNTRFNIIRVEEYETTAISDFKIINKDELVSQLRKIFRDVSEKIGGRIEKTILLIPAYNFKRFPLKSTVNVEHNVVEKTDIARAIKNSLKSTVTDDVMIVNPVINKYTLNGIATRRMPENEQCDSLVVDIDLLCADISMCYEYVSAVEESGVNVMDIVLNNYAVAKEASLFEESLKKNVIVLDVNRTCTYLSLISKGKLVSTEIIYDGLNSIINNVYRSYYVPYKDIPKLVKYCCDFDSENLDYTVYGWSDQGSNKNLTIEMLNEAVIKPLYTLCEKLITMCNPIIESGAMIVLTGEGQQMKMLNQTLRQMAGCEIREYYPETIGVRNPALTALYGSFIVYREKALLNNQNVSCVDLVQYNSLIEKKEIDSEGETITTKIRNLFRQYIDKGGI